MADEVSKQGGRLAGVDGRILQDLYNRMSIIDVPKVSGGTVKFQLEFAIWGGAGKSGDVTPGN